MLDHLRVREDEPAFPTVANQHLSNRGTFAFNFDGLATKAVRRGEGEFLLPFLLTYNRGFCADDNSRERLEFRILPRPLVEQRSRRDSFPRLPPQ